MTRFMDEYRKGRDEARAARGAPPLAVAKENTEPNPTFDAPADDARQSTEHCSELEATLRQRDGEVTELKRLIAELTAYAEDLQAQVKGLQAAAAPLVAVLQMPGVARRPAYALSPGQTSKRG